MYPSEGVRLLVMAMAERGVNDAEVERMGGLANGAIGKLKQGKRGGPGRVYAAFFTETFGIPPLAWDEPPREDAGSTGGEAA